MKPKKIASLLTTLTASLIAMSVQAETTPASLPQPAVTEPEVEKCFGVVKAGMNDCSSAYNLHSCAGHAQRDADPGEWLLVPKGLCDRLAAGALSAPEDQ